MSMAAHPSSQINARIAHLDVSGLDYFISTAEENSANNTTEDVDTSTLHQGHETLGLDDLDTAVQRGLVVDALKMIISIQ